MDQAEERWALVDACQGEVEERLGYSLTADEWTEICVTIYDEAKESFLESIESMVEDMECVNAPA